MRDLRYFRENDSRHVKSTYHKGCKKFIACTKHAFDAYKKAFSFIAEDETLTPIAHSYQDT